MYSVIVKKKNGDEFEQIGGVTKVEDEYLGSLTLHIRNRLEERFDNVSVFEDFNDAHELVAAQIIGGPESDPIVQVEMAQASTPLDPYRNRLRQVEYYINRSYLEHLNQTSE
jgi:hypothetical protein